MKKNKLAEQPITVRVSPQTLEILTKAAEQNDRTLTYLIRKAADLYAQEIEKEESNRPF